MHQRKPMSKRLLKTNLLPNVIELNKLLGTRQVAPLEISWHSTIKKITDGTFETNAAFNDDNDPRNLSHDDFESVDEEEIKQENLLQASTIIQQKQQLLLGAGTISRNNHSSLLFRSSNEGDDSESGEGIRRDQRSVGRYNSVDDLMMELCQKTINTTRRWPFSWTLRRENQRLEIYAADNKEPSAQNPSPPFFRYLPICKISWE